MQYFALLGWMALNAIALGATRTHFLVVVGIWIATVLMVLMQAITMDLAFAHLDLIAGTSAVLGLVWGLPYALARLGRLNWDLQHKT